MNITNYAPAIKETISGETVICKNASPLKHNLDVRVRSKNLFTNELITDSSGSSIEKLDKNSCIITANGTGDTCYQGFCIEVPKSETFTLSINYLVENTPNTTSGRLNYLYIWKRKNTNKGNSPNTLVTTKDTEAIDGVQNTVQITLKASDFIGYQYMQISWYANTAILSEVPEIPYKATLTNIQLEEGSTVTAYTPYRTEFEGIEVSRYGKNLFNINRYESDGVPPPSPDRYNPETYTIGQTRNGYYKPSNITDYKFENNGVTMTTKTAYYGIGFPFILKPNTDYMFSCIVDNVTNFGIGVGFFNENWVHLSNVSGYRKSNITFNTGETENVIIVPTPIVANVSVTCSDMQLELGEPATEYESYKEPQIATANTDGTVEGLTSVSPNMTLLTNNNDVVIDCTYNKSTKAYIDEKVSALSAALLEV